VREREREREREGVDSVDGGREEGEEEEEVKFPCINIQKRYNVCIMTAYQKEKGASSSYPRMVWLRKKPNNPLPFHTTRSPSSKQTRESAQTVAHPLSSCPVPSHSLKRHENEPPYQPSIQPMQMPSKKG